MAGKRMNKSEPGKLERIAVCESEIPSVLPFSTRTWRRLRSAGKVPQGYKVGGKLLWYPDDLREWAALGFPDRRRFEEIREENRR